MATHIIAPPVPASVSPRRQAAINLINGQNRRITAQSVTKRVAIYLRVSTQEQVLGFGLDSQDDSCTAFVNRKNEIGPDTWIIHDIYRDEGESGAKEDRPAILRLERDVQAGLIDVVVVYRFDRIGRTGRAFWRWVWALQEAGVSIVSVTQNIDTTTNDGKGQLGIYATFSEMEWNAIRERTQNGLNMKAREGGWIGGRPPFGYEILDKGTRKSRLSPCAKEIEVLERAAEYLVDKGYAADRAAAKLNALGPKYMTRSELPWTGANLRRKFFNTALDGFIVFRNTDPEVNKGRKRPTTLGPDGNPLYGQTYIIDTDLIIPLERLYEVREALRGRSWNKSGPHHYYPLTKRVFGLCGNHYIGQYDNVKDERFYRCSGGKKCTDSSIPAQPLEDVVWLSLAGFLENKEKLRELADEWIGDAPDYREAYVERLAELDKEMASIRGFLATQLVELSAAGVDPLAIAAASESMTAKLKEKQSQHADATEMLAEAESNFQRSVDIQSLIDLASFNLVAFGPREKSELMNLLDIKVRLVGEVPRRFGGPPCPVETWFAERDIYAFPELTEELWAQIEPSVPAPKVIRKNTMDAREAVAATLYKLRNGVGWYSLPDRFPEGPSVKSRILRWIAEGAWERMMAPVMDSAPPASAAGALPPMEISGNIDPRLVRFSEGAIDGVVMDPVVGELSWAGSFTYVVNQDDLALIAA